MRITKTTNPTPDDWVVAITYTDWKGRTKTRHIGVSSNVKTKEEAETAALASIYWRGQAPPNVIKIHGERRQPGDFRRKVEMMQDYRARNAAIFAEPATCYPYR